MAMKLRTSASFRAVATSSHIIQEYHTASFQTAAPSTILWWIRKLGYHALTRPHPRADDWVILLDHTVKIGADKLFVIMGIRERNMDFTRPLRYEDLTPLWMSVSSHWNGPVIRDILLRLQQRLGRIKYAVGDYGSDIRKGLRLAEIAHVHDVTHRIALTLKTLYADDATFQTIMQRLARIRRRFWLSVAGHLVPPGQRTKSRYHNLRPLAEYGRQMLAYLDQADKTVSGEDTFRDAMAWIREYRAFFMEMDEVTNAVTEVERLVKRHGLSIEMIEACGHQLATVSTEKGYHFKFDILVYFHMMLALPRMRDTILCTSDILESAFGKYKNYVSCNPMAGITDLALCIAAFTCPLTPEEITVALESVREEAVRQWARVFLGTPLLRKRRQAFSGNQSVPNNQGDTHNPL